MIKYNNNNIVDWNLASDNIKKVYRNGNLCYQKIAESVPPTPPAPYPTVDGKLVLTYEVLNIKNDVGSIQCSINNVLDNTDIDPTWYSANTAYFGDCESATRINANALINLTNLETVYFPKNFTYPSSAPLFANGKPRYVYFPSDSVSTTIGGYMFKSASLTSITLPSSITLVKEHSFESSNLEVLTMLSTTPPTLGEDAFFNTRLNAIYVPSASVNAYKTASGWSNYANIIQAIQ